MAVTDDFNRADTGSNGGFGANWTHAGSGATEIISNQARGGSGGAYAVDFYSGTSWNSTHSSQILKASAVAYVAPAVRCAAGGGPGIWVAYYEHGELQLCNGGSVSSIASGITTYANTDTAKLSVSGTSYTPNKNGSDGTPVVDATLSGGSPGIGFYSNGSAIDDFVGTGEAIAFIARKPLMVNTAVKRANYF